MKKFLALAIACAEFAMPAMATETQTAAEQDSWKETLAKLPKVSGYLQTGWNFTDSDAGSVSSFQAKRLRLLMDGNVASNISFRLQIEAFNGIAGSTNGNGQKNLQVMDAFATWSIMPEFKVRAGQFYTPLGYENYDISPATLETVDFSNIVYNMACRNPYEYDFVDYGRDLGVMFIGDLFDSGKGFKYLHYDVALTNGSIPCKDDSNKSKDIYVSATVRPIKNFNVKATFNHGEYTKDYAPMNRVVVGAWYDNPTGLLLRGEYGMMKSKVENVEEVNQEGAYVIAGWHANKWLPVVRWDMYKNKLNENVSGMNYNRILLGCTYQVTKNFKVQANYGHFMYDKDKTGLESSEQIQVMGLFKF